MMRHALAAMATCTLVLISIAYSLHYLDPDTYIPVFPSRRASVAVVNTSLSSHKEVHGMLLWILIHLPLSVKFYRHTELDTSDPVDEPYVQGFPKILAPFWGSGNDRHVDDFARDLAQDSSIRYVVMTTCEWDWSLLEGFNWDREINVVCIQHWEQDFHSVMRFVGSQGRLGVATLGDHVLKSFGTTLVKNGSPPTGRLVPVFPLDTERLGLVNGTAGGINSAVIQSRWWNGFRDMDRVYADLLYWLEADAQAWGYKWEDGVYKPLRPDRFILHLIGTDPAPYPPELEHLVQLHVGLSNPEFFAVIAGADVLLPAFQGNGYVTNRASSSIGVAASVGTPILADRAMANAYGYFCDASAIIRPEGVTEIDYIAMVRRGEVPWRSRRESRREIGLCRERWTGENVKTLARLMGMDGA